MKKKSVYLVALAVVLCGALAAGIFLNLDRFRYINNQETEPEEDKLPAGMFVYGCSEAPYKVGDFRFRAEENGGQYRYKVFGAAGEMPAIEPGFDASGWEEIKNEQVISGTDCRKVAIVRVDEHGKAEEALCYDYLPGVVYGDSNPDQYDDPALFDADDPTREDPRAVALAGNLFRSANTAYYGNDYGYVIRGFLSKYGSTGGLLENYYHTGIDFNTQAGRPFYAPISGTLVYAGNEDAYHTLAIYNEEKDITLLILHGADVSPAFKRLEQDDTDIVKGDLLGYGGSAGNPTGDTQLHVELHKGASAGYNRFSKNLEYSRVVNYDPLIVSDLFSLQVPAENGFEDTAVKLGTDAFSAQNGSIVCQVGNWLYFVNSLNGGKLCKARPDGSGVKILTESAVTNLNYMDGYLYYSDLTNQGVLTKMKTDGSAAAVLSLVNASGYILVTADWVYFANGAGTNQIYRCRKDGSEGAKLLDREIQHIFYDNGCFYYTQNATRHAERLVCYDTNKGTITQLFNSRIDKPFVLNGNLCFRRYYSDKFALSLPAGDLNEEHATVVIPSAYEELARGSNYTVYTNVNDGNALYIKFDQLDGVYKLSYRDAACRNLKLAGGWLYYLSPMLGGETLCRIQIDSMHRQEMKADGTWVATELTCQGILSYCVKAARTDDWTEVRELLASGYSDTIVTVPADPAATPYEGSPIETLAPTPQYTPAPSTSPSATPTAGPVTPKPTTPPDIATITPGAKTPIPTKAPTAKPTTAPTAAPTPKPTAVPTEVPGWGFDE